MGYAVQVNETMVTATGQGRSWWATYARIMADRITEQPNLGGAVCTVACESKDEATWLASQMVGHGGLPKAAVEVVRTTEAA